MTTTVKKPFEFLWRKVQRDCCPEWSDYATFETWAKKTRTARTLRRKLASAPYSSCNCFWSASYGPGDEFRKKVIALRGELLGEDHSAAAEWFSSVSHQRRYEWFRLNTHKTLVGSPSN